MSLIYLKKKQAVFATMLLATVVGSYAVQSCSKKDAVSNNASTDSTSTSTLTAENLPGGVNGSINATSRISFAQELPNFLTAQSNQFKIGRTFFHTAWVTAPASTTGVDGLGPLFNAISCNSCHVEDGRGRTPFSTTEQLSSVLIRTSIAGQDAHGGPNPDPQFGLQFRNKSIVTATPDGTVNVSYEEMSGKYPDGTTYSLRKPTYTFTNTRSGAAIHLFSPRIAPQMIGMGLLEALPESVILANVDSADANKDGISGRANYVWNDTKSATVLGRFGWKANEPTIEQQVAGAFSGDIGISNPIYPNQNLWGDALTAYASLPTGSDSVGVPEIPSDFFEQTVLYSAGLAVPVRRDYKNDTIVNGRNLFQLISCGKCHIAQMQTGTYGLIDLLSNQVIHAYTDLLLHDMGDSLADGRPDYRATGNEWRTPPLWGIGLITTVSGNDYPFLLHDGRARSVEEAILWHGGEAEASKVRFMNLSAAERTAIIRFINDL